MSGTGPRGQNFGVLTAQRSQVGQIHVVETLSHRRCAAASLDQRLQSQPVRELVRRLGDVQMEFVNERRQDLPDLDVVASPAQRPDGVGHLVSQFLHWAGTIDCGRGQRVGLERDPERRNAHMRVGTAGDRGSDEGPRPVQFLRLSKPRRQQRCGCDGPACVVHARPWTGTRPKPRLNRPARSGSCRASGGAPAAERPSSRCHTSSQPHSRTAVITA